MEKKSPRELTLQYEKNQLSEHAFLCENSAGRAKPEPPCPLRTDFQRDRDRIIHCNSFRRLKHKTQVFLMPQSEHYRTRLTHTLEVSQIARTIARALRLNEDLTEAIALGHDLGHTPFGHDGERALNAIFSKGFRHNEQSLRVADIIEKNGENIGLNLTDEVRDGIFNHTTKGIARTLEGQIVRFSDKIAYINHDIEDAIRAGVLSQSDLPEFPLKILGDSKSKRITKLINSVLENSLLEEQCVQIRYDPETQKAHDELRRFMFNHVYFKSQINAEKEKARFVIEVLFKNFEKHPEKMPEQYQKIAEKDGNDRAAADFISGMTDDYAIYMFTELCVPKKWVVDN
ncbi:MAG: deoxyguanosinetriphosphate triphosphohydrolase [Oscillospiraceae bacterium]|nr:deoxyguanosinetriphosphate triphosphohydrolase [Oscillospiraceae bacterium]